MSMRIQEALSNFCSSISGFASSAASQIAKFATTIGSAAVETTKKVADFVRPQFENIRTWAQENRQSILVAAVAFTVGAIGTAIAYNVFARGADVPASTSATTLADSTTLTTTTV